MDIRDGLAAESIDSTRQILFEYFRRTHADAGMPVPARVHDLDADLRAECLDPASVYRAPSLFVLAYADDVVLGCAGLVSVDRDTAELTRLYVRPRHRGGRGAELATYVIDRARRSGASEVVLSVLRNRSRARELYANLGFEISSTSRSGGDFVDMRLRLPSGEPAGGCPWDADPCRGNVVSDRAGPSG